MKEIKLSKPIMAHNEKIYVLELREPTYDELEELGIPFSYTSSGEMKIDAGSSLKYIPLLAGIPRSSAASMSKKDIFITCMNIIGFFTESDESAPPESDSTIPPISGK